jgi:hypothetical protein
MTSTPDVPGVAGAVIRSQRTLGEDWQSLGHPSALACPILVLAMRMTPVCLPAADMTCGRLDRPPAVQWACGIYYGAMGACRVGGVGVGWCDEGGSRMGAAPCSERRGTALNGRQRLSTA